MSNPKEVLDFLEDEKKIKRKKLEDIEFYLQVTISNLKEIQNVIKEIKNK